MSKQDYSLAAGLAAITFILCAVFSWQMPVTDPVESNYVLTAVEMNSVRDYMTPRIYGHPWFDKPILVYWGLLAALKLGGSNDFVLRLPSLLTAALTIGCTYAVWKRLTGRTVTALLTACLLMTSLQFWYMAHAIVTDGYLYLFTLGIFYYAYRGFHERPRYFIAAYAFAGLAVLTKGPVGLILPGLLLLLYCAVRRRFGDSLRLFPWRGWLLFSLIALPWYLYMYALHGADYMLEFLGLHNVVRATVSEHPAFDVWYYYLVVLLLQVVPWTGVLFFQGCRLYRHRRSLSSLTLYSLVWFAGILLFYSLMSTKYLTYTYIALIPLSYLLADGVIALAQRSLRLRLAVQALPYGLLTLALALAGPSLFPQTPYVCWLPLGIGTVLLYRYGRRPLALFGAVTAATALLYGTLAYALPPVVNDASAAAVSRQLPADYDGDVYFYYTFAPSFNVYSGRSARLLSADDTPPDDQWLRFREIMPKIGPGELARHLSSGTAPATIIAVPRSKETRFTALPVSRYVTPYASAGSYRLYRYEPQ